MRSPRFTLIDVATLLIGQWLSCCVRCRFEITRYSPESLSGFGHCDLPFLKVLRSNFGRKVNPISTHFPNFFGTVSGVAYGLRSSISGTVCQRFELEECFQWELSNDGVPTSRQQNGRSVDSSHPCGVQTQAHVNYSAVVLQIFQIGYRKSGDESGALSCISHLSQISLSCYVKSRSGRTKGEKRGKRRCNSVDCIPVNWRERRSEHVIHRSIAKKRFAWSHRFEPLRLQA